MEARTAAASWDPQVLRERSRLWIAAVGVELNGLREAPRIELRVARRVATDAAGLAHAVAADVAVRAVWAGEALLYLPVHDGVVNHAAVHERRLAGDTSRSAATDANHERFSALYGENCLI
jgi:hypothetical protein